MNKWITLALFAHLIAAIFSTGMHHWDEHFQILEFINLKKGLTTSSQLPWEFKAKMRPWIMPFFYYYLDLGFSPFIQVFFYRLLSGILGLGAIYSLFIIGKDFVKNHRLLLILSCSLWFFPYIHARISSEAIGASLFSIALFLYLKKEKSFLSGLLMGLSFYCRFHIGVMILFLFIHELMIRKTALKKLTYTSLGVILIIALGTLIDYWGYNEWVFTPWEYLKQNLLYNKVSGYGINPWYDYFKFVFNKSFAPIGLLIIISHLYLWIKHPKNLFTWLTLPFFIIHTLIGHKELRFLFPLIHFIPIIFVIFYEKLNRFPKTFKTIFAFNIVLLFIYSTQEVHPSYSYFKYAYSKDLKKLYTLGDTNPYKLAQLDVTYFVKKAPEIISLKDDINLDTISRPFYLFSNRGKFHQRLASTRSCHLEYANYPKFLLKYNPFNWQKKSKIWSVYKCID